MSVKLWVARLSIVAVVLASMVIGGTPAQAASQAVTGTVLLASNGGGVARREWTASSGAVNGVNGYVVAVAPATVGTAFTLGLPATNAGGAAPTIAFSPDMPNGITSSPHSRNPAPSGAARWH